MVKDVFDVDYDWFGHSLRLASINTMNVFSFKEAQRIVKEIRRRKVSFGTYSCLDDAKTVRDKLMSCDWDKSQLENILKDCGVERNPVGGFHKKNK